MAVADRVRSAAFDRLMALAGFWSVLGIFTDLGWHIRNHVDTFFTPQHALLYSGLIALFAVSLLGMRRPGYALSVSGIALFAAGGIADLIKHELFGIEHDFDALVSPTHLALGFGIALAAAGPLRSALAARPRPFTLAAQLPAIVSSAAVLELLHWITNPFFRANVQRALETRLPHALTPDALTLQTLHVYEQGGGLIALILQALLMVGFALYLVRNFRLRPGAITLLMLLGNILIAFTNSIAWQETAAVLLASLASGIAGDAFLPGIDALRASRLRYACFAVAIPAAYFVVYLGVIAALLGGIWWDASFASGAVVEACVFALFLSFLAFTRHDDAPDSA